MEPQIGLLPSILDRLDDPESRGTIARPGYTVEQMAQSIQDDLQRLLNTRSDDSAELQPYRLYAMVAGYGLPDMTCLSRLADGDIQRICGLMEAKILKYEPRLKEVRVTVKANNDPLKVQLNLRAVLAVDPAPELAFDTTLDLGTGHFIQAKAS